MVLIGDARQATNGGESGPVEAGLTETVAFVYVILYLNCLSKTCNFMY